MFHPQHGEQTRLCFQFVCFLTPKSFRFKKGEKIEGGTKREKKKKPEKERNLYMMQQYSVPAH